MTDVTVGANMRDADASREGGDAAAGAKLPQFEEAPKASNWKRVVRFLETARQLKARQALFWAIRRGWGRSFRTPARAGIRIRHGVRMQAELVRPACELGDNEVEFLNTRCRFDDGIDWHNADNSKLWQYNLHYFDYALDEGRSPDWIREAMEDWIRRNPPCESVGWEPYPVSLRIANWIKFDLRAGRSGQLPPVCKHSL